MFVKFDCGCVGFYPGIDDMVVITSDCREGGDTFWLTPSKYYDEKKREPLPPDKIREQLDILEKMWGLGFAMSELNSALSSAQRILQRPRREPQGSLPPAGTDP